MKQKLPFFTIVSLFFIFTPIFFVSAARLYLIPENQIVEVGDEFELDLRLDTEGASINASQVVLSFPNDVLELIGVSKIGSIFDFWLQEPTVSNETGQMNFIGGTPSGVQGGALHILNLRFRAFSSGSGAISFSNAVVTANDGKGTDVLSEAKGTAITANEAGKIAVPSTPEPAPTIEEPEVEIPVVIERKPVPSGKLPSAPQLRVPLYPDESKWYNHLGEVIVLWNVPDDVIRMATAIDHNPKTSPQNTEEQLFTGKSFGVLSDGVWYVHVQFRNNVGWGPEAHYKISIDTIPPLPFEAAVDEEASDNPSPKIFFGTYDSLSGISRALIYIDNRELLESKETSSVLPLQPPGKKLLKVRIFDLAGNSVEDDLEFEILPLQAPIIESVARQASGSEPVFVSGSSFPGSFIDLRIYDRSDREVYKETTESDSLGNWELFIKENLPFGKYAITATARDERGALSYPSERSDFRIRSRVVASFGPIDLGWLEILLFVMLVVISVPVIIILYNMASKKRRYAYKVIIGRDVEKFKKLLEDQIGEVGDWMRETKNTIPTKERTEAEYGLGKMKEILDRMKRYLLEEISKIK